MRETAADDEPSVCVRAEAAQCGRAFSSNAQGARLLRVGGAARALPEPPARRAARFDAAGANANANANAYSYAGVGLVSVSACACA